MPTTTVKSIGSAGGRDYSTPQAWEDASPSNIVTSDEIWKGECYKDSEFVRTNANQLTAGGITTDDTRFLWLTTAAGEGFADDASPGTLPLRYDTSKGVSLRSTGGYSGGFHCGSVRVLIEGLMFKHDTASYSTGFSFTGGVFRRMIIEGVKTNQWTSGGSKFINCLLYDYGSGANSVGIVNDVFTACTVVRASDASSGGTAMKPDFGYYPDLKSTAVFGFATNFSGTIASYNNCNNVASDSASVPGTSAQTSLTYSSQFENTTAASRDWRVKSGATLISNGSRHQGTEGDYSTLGTNDIDIIGQARSTTTPTIGCWEVTSSTQTRTVTASGGMQLGGAAGVLRYRVAGVSGGIQLAGTAVAARARGVTPSGGMTFGGTAAQLRTAAPAPSGGINFGGTAAVSFVGQNVREVTASGGLSLGGAASIARIRQCGTAAGGIQFGGTAAVTTHEAVRTVSASGGLQLGGSAAVQFLVAGGSTLKHTMRLQLRAFGRKALGASRRWL